MNDDEIPDLELLAHLVDNLEPKARTIVRLRCGLEGAFYSDREVARMLEMKTRDVSQELESAAQTISLALREPAISSIYRLWDYIRAADLLRKAQDSMIASRPVEPAPGPR